MAFRLSQRAVTTTVAILASLSLWGTLHGFGPFAQAAPHVALLLLQTFMGVMAVTTTIVAAVVAELKQATATVVQLNQELEQRVQERTTALATANAALRHEMTERQHAEAERRRLEFETQRAEHFALLGRLAAGISHEIRNPLGAIFLHVDLLEEELRAPSPDSPTQVTESLAEIKTHLVRLEDLVQDYLTLTRVVTIAQKPQDLGTAVSAWAAEWQTLAATQGVTLRLVGLAEVGQVAFHAATLRRALLNLIQNALDAMLHGGLLTLEGQGTTTDVKLHVRDTGSGIPSEHLSQIFEPLFTTKPGGTGLGLYIVQEIVTAHGGQVTVESKVGHGTTFTITLSRTGPQGPNQARCLAL
jgi:signal transduction histidine kinase